VAKTAYLDTSIFLEMAGNNVKLKKRIRELLEELSDEKVRLYTSVITVQELAVATYRMGAVPRDTYADINSIARIYTVTKDVAMTAAKREAELKDLAERGSGKRGSKRAVTPDEKLERICENRRRKWDCFHLATAQITGCGELYTTDSKLQKRPELLGIKNLIALTPDTPVKTIRGPLLENVGTTST
jgi:predicted nucleic acid-binding protein